MSVVSVVVNLHRNPCVGRPGTHDVIQVAMAMVVQYGPA